VVDGDVDVGECVAVDDGGVGGEVEAGGVADFVAVVDEIAVVVDGRRNGRSTGNC